MTDTPRTGLEFVDAGTTDIDQPVNNNALALDAVVGMSVVSATTTAEPTLTSPADDGKVYILPAGRTGTNWGAQAVGTIAQWYSGNWYFYAPWSGLRARSSTTGIIYQYTTSWAVWASVFGQSLLDDSDAPAARTTLGLSDGSYTPTITAGTNATSGTGFLTSWLRVGDSVTLSGRADIISSLASTYTTARVSIPVASNFSAGTDVSGPAAWNIGTGELSPAFINADPTNNEIVVNFISSVTPAITHTVRFSVTYRVFP